jgi:hypothetical protein
MVHVTGDHSKVSLLTPGSGGTPTNTSAVPRLALTVSNRNSVRLPEAPTHCSTTSQSESRKGDRVTVTERAMSVAMNCRSGMPSPDTGGETSGGASIGGAASGAPTSGGRLR